MGGQDGVVSELIRIDDLNDPRLDPYRNLKDRDLARDGDRFIAESEQVVRRLIASEVRVQSILLAEKRVEKMRDVLPATASVYVLSDALIEQVIGFHFHSGVMAVGVRPNPISLSSFLATLPARATLMYLPDTNNTENLGTLMRVAAGFGVAGLLLGPRCCDPYYRQAVRVSMATVFALRIVRVDDDLATIDALREANIECIATMLDPAAEPLTDSDRTTGTALLFGNESSGLSIEIASRCDRRVTIPMELGTDSLNVAVAAGIVMHHFTRVAKSTN